MNKVLSFAALSVVLLAACQKEDQSISGNAGNLEYVSVSIDVTAGNHVPMTGTVTATKSVAAEVPGPDDDAIICDAVLPEASIETKVATGINDPADASQTTIKNLWVLQYDGTGNTAKLIGTPAYIADYTVAANRTAKLVASTSANTIVFLANTFDSTLPFQQNSTISELKGRLFITKSLDKIVVKDPVTATTGTATFPDDGDYYQRLNGYVEQAITEGGSLNCTLAHNACRISVNVTNNTASTTYPVTLTSADVENVPGCIYFFTNYTGYTSGNNVGKPITHSQFNEYGMQDYYDVITWTAAEGASATPKNAKLYLSANESGIVTANESPKLKSLFAPTNATVLRIYGTYSDGTNDIPVKYTFALGEDMVKNYQLVPNGDYVYNITLNSRGDKASDGRVSYQDANGVDYTQSTWPLSNCYICNPPSVATRSNTYKIPVARVDQFWGNNGYENVGNNCLAQNNPWTVSVIWSDMPINASNFVITKATGAGKEDYFEVSVPGTSEMGNVVIGIKNNQSSEWLWSWHLWVTDYCPDEGKYLAQQGAFLAGTDTYHITGGDVQRYKAAATGTVQKVYMDRGIGAMSKDYVGYGKGMLYYQFGRKDPFPGKATYWENGTTEQNDGFIVNTTATKKNVIAYNATDTQPCNVPYSVTHPTTFIYSSAGYWTYKDKYNPEMFANTIVWQDPYSSSNGNKSIFDPSPSGWKVPTTFDGTSYKSFSGGIGYASTTLVPGAGSVALVASGYRSLSNGSLGYGGSAGLYWRSSPNSVTLGTYLYFCSGSWNVSNGGSNRACGFPVCPVQE